MTEEILKEDKYSKVYRVGEWVYKEQPEFLAKNELWFLQQMYPTGYVPESEYIDGTTIRTKYIKQAAVSYPEVFMDYYESVLSALSSCGIRHGDLTKYAVLVNYYDDSPMLIDFAESRLMCDSRPDKRPEGDKYWLYKTMTELSGINDREILVV